MPLGGERGIGSRAVGEPVAQLVHGERRSRQEQEAAACEHPRTERLVIAASVAPERLAARSASSSTGASPTTLRRPSIVNATSIVSCLR